MHTTNQPNQPNLTKDDLQEVLDNFQHLYDRASDLDLEKVHPDAYLDFTLNQQTNQNHNHNHNQTTEETILDVLESYYYKPPEKWLHGTYRPEPASPHKYYGDTPVPVYVAARPVPGGWDVRVFPCDQLDNDQLFSYGKDKDIVDMRYIYWTWRDIVDNLEIEENVYLDERKGNKNELPYVY